MNSPMTVYGNNAGSAVNGAAVGSGPDDKKTFDAALENAGSNATGGSQNEATQKALLSLFSGVTDETMNIANQTNKKLEDSVRDGAT